MPEREARGPRRPRPGGDGGGYMALPGAGGGGGAGPSAVQQYAGPGGARQPGQQYGGQQAPGYADSALLAAVGQADLRYGF